MAFLGVPGPGILVLCPSDHNAAPLTLGTRLTKSMSTGTGKKHESAEACREGNWDSILGEVESPHTGNFPTFQGSLIENLCLKPRFVAFWGPEFLRRY